MASAENQQRDKLLLRLLKTPPAPRPKRKRGAEKATRTRGKRAAKSSPSAQFDCGKGERGP